MCVTDYFTRGCFVSSSFFSAERTQCAMGEWAEVIEWLCANSVPKLVNDLIEDLLLSKPGEPMGRMQHKLTLLQPHRDRSSSRFGQQLPGHERGGQAHRAAHGQDCRRRADAAATGRMEVLEEGFGTFHARRFGFAPVNARAAPEPASPNRSPEPDGGTQPPVSPSAHHETLGPPPTDRSAVP